MCMASHSPRCSADVIRAGSSGKPAHPSLASIKVSWPCVGTFTFILISATQDDANNGSLKINYLICQVVSVASQAISTSKELWERLSYPFTVLMLAMEVHALVGCYVSWISLTFLSACRWSGILENSFFQSLVASSFACSFQDPNSFWAVTN